MEHELSAVYDITHGLGLAILTPRWMEYCLDDTTVDKFVQYGVNVFGIDASQDKMAIARESIRLTEEFLFEKLGLQRTFTEVGIKREDFELMAEKACRYGDIKGFKTLTKEDVVRIFEMCM
jgi:alcohol dehydrogenase YqhD (iron-dependent ADH family)